MMKIHVFKNDFYNCKRNLNNYSNEQFFNRNNSMQDTVSFSAKRITDNKNVKKYARVDVEKTHFAVIYPDLVETLKTAFKDSNLNNREKAVLVLTLGPSEKESLKSSDEIAKICGFVSNGTASAAKVSALSKIKDKKLKKDIAVYCKDYGVKKSKDSAEVSRLANINLDETHFAKLCPESLEALQAMFRNPKLTNQEKAFIILEFQIEDGKRREYIGMVEIFGFQLSKIVKVKNSALKKMENKELRQKLDDYKIYLNGSTKLPNKLNHLLSLENTALEKVYGREELEKLKDAFKVQPITDKTLNNAEKGVLVLFYGVQNGIPREQHEIIKIIGYSKAEMSRIYLSAFKKISDLGLILTSERYLLDLKENMTVPDEIRKILNLENTAFEKRCGKTELENLKEVFNPKEASASNLTPIEKIVMILRYGIKENNILSYTKTGAHFGMRVHQIQAIERRALSKIQALDKDLVEKLETYAFEVSRDAAMPEEFRYLLDLENSAYEAKYGKDELKKLQIAIDTAKLSEKERAILALYYGIKDRNYKNFHQISDMSSCRWQTSRYYLIKAMGKLPENIRKNLLKHLDSIKYNSPEIVEQLYQKHYKTAVAMSRKAGRYGLDAENIAHMALYGAARNYKGLGRFESLLYKHIEGQILKGFANMYKNKASSLDTELRDDFNLYDTIADPKSMTPAELVQNKEIRDMVEKLPEDMRTVVELCFGFAEEPKDFAEIALILNISEDNAKKLLEQALQTLRDNI